MTSPRILATPDAKAVAAGKRLVRRPGVAHIKATLVRYGERLGNQFSAAITYFLVLALIPTLMFAFASLGFFLDVVRPELVVEVKDTLHEVAPDQEQLVDLLENFLDNWRAVGLVGVVTALYTAQGFIGNLQDAIRTQLRSRMTVKAKTNFFVRMFMNIVILLGLLVGIAVTIVLTVAGTGLQSSILTWLNLPAELAPLLVLVPLLISATMAWLIFMFIFTMIPLRPIPMRTRAQGSLMGAIAFTLLLNFATLLIELFSSSPTAALFGPIIAVMLSMNIFARIVLMVAAWMGTAEERSIFSTVPDSTPGEEPSAMTSRVAEAKGLVWGIGLVVLTLLGFRVLELRRDS